mmetsp:Transcript_38486/g.112654  ORF Transcript_38486/g.112654 Transcript_38486/m.112654 type:complete len:280 (-) Transcript_38486:322-1161(-)
MASCTVDPTSKLPTALLCRESRQSGARQSPTRRHTHWKWAAETSTAAEACAPLTLPIPLCGYARVHASRVRAALGRTRPPVAWQELSVARPSMTGPTSARAKTGWLDVGEARRARRRAARGERLRQLGALEECVWRRERRGGRPLGCRRDHLDARARELRPERHRLEAARHAQVKIAVGAAPPHLLEREHEAAAAVAHEPRHVARRFRHTLAADAADGGLGARRRQYGRPRRLLALRSAAAVRSQRCGRRRRRPRGSARWRGGARGLRRNGDGGAGGGY